MRKPSPTPSTPPTPRPPSKSRPTAGKSKPPQPRKGERRLFCASLVRALCSLVCAGRGTRARHGRVRRSAVRLERSDCRMPTSRPPLRNMGFHGPIYLQIFPPRPRCFRIVATHRENDLGVAALRARDSWRIHRGNGTRGGCYCFVEESAAGAALGLGSSMVLTPSILQLNSLPPSWRK